LGRARLGAGASEIVNHDAIPARRRHERRGDFSMKQVLVVDDSPVIRKTARRILEGMQLQTSEAVDGEQALNACSFLMPDAIIVDWSMPVVDGFEFIKQLRRMPGGDKPKVLFCTSEYDVAQIARAMHSGADDILLKPFDKDIVKAKFEDIGIPAA
jgi:two-component system, chemotaxis family, chemotaxis protein CheY